jgi:guanylate kinase
MKKGKIFVISGPAGVGKGSVLKKLLETRENVFISVSATTRLPRAGEEDGVHYHFLDVDTFHKWIAQDAFLEYAEYVGNFYGTPRRFVDEALEKGQDVILEIDVRGAEQIAQKRPEAVLVFIAPPSWEELERRLVQRGTESPEKIEKRLLRARVECRTASTYHYFVINDTIENAAKELNAIMTAEHCRSMERMEVISGS